MDRLRRTRSGTATSPNSPRELPLGPAHRARQEATLRQALAPRIDGELMLTLTENRAVMLSVRRQVKRRHYAVRLHRVFCEAPDSVLDALARYIEFDDADAVDQLQVYIEAVEDQLPASEPRSRNAVLRTDGKVFDLQEVFDRINARYFEGQVTAQISWGRRTQSFGPRRSVRLGSYCVEDQLIRIHPGLDRPWVPAFYLEWVVFHEMLHAVHPVRRVNGRNEFHGPTFTSAERSYENYAQANAWQKQHLTALLAI